MKELHERTCDFVSQLDLTNHPRYDINRPSASVPRTEIAFHCQKESGCLRLLVKEDDKGITDDPQRQRAT